MKNDVDNKLKSVVVIVILAIWVISTVVSIVLPDRQTSTGVTTMMGAVVGYFLVDKITRVR